MNTAGSRSSGPKALNVFVQRRMSQQARIGTKPELAIRRMLHADGFRYRVGYPVPGRPRRTIDIAFTKARLAVFVDGCFWHRCPLHWNAPKNNSAWWDAKMAANEARDLSTDEALIRAGWTSLRIWEHEEPLVAFKLIAEALAGLTQRDDALTDSPRAP